MAVIEILLPRTSDAMTEAVVLQVITHTDSVVVEGTVLMEIETDKAMVEVPATESGLFLTSIQGGDTVQVGSVLGFILTGLDVERFRSGELAMPGQSSLEQKSVNQSSSVPAITEAVPAVLVVEDGAPSLNAATREGMVFASPLARRLAKQADIPLRSIMGTGPNGRIVRDDVTRTQAKNRLTPSTTAVSPATKIESTAREQSLAAAMRRSKSEVPHFYLARTVDMKNFMDLRSLMKCGGQPVPSLTAFLVKAMAIAMDELDFCRRIWTAEGVMVHQSIGVGVAVSDGPTEIVVPVIHDPQRKSVQDVADEIGLLSATVRARTLKQHQITGALMTLSNLGMFGIDEMYAIIPPDQNAIVGVGRVVNVPVVTPDGSFSATPQMKISFAGDHRVISGVGGAQFLTTVDALLQKPFGLLDVIR